MVAPTSVHEAPDSVESHRLRVVGYLHGSRAARILRQIAVRPDMVPSRDVCASPLLWRCEAGCCVDARPCGNHRESRCTPCATRYRRRVGRLIEAGATSFGRTTSGHSYLLTVNAPGNPGHNRWIPGRAGLHGVCGCEESRAAGDGVWNASASARWNLLRTRLVQEHPGLAYARCVEVQRRGLIHLHVVVHSPTALSSQRVQELALSAGFGCVMDLAALDDPGKSARYLAKYVSKSVDQRGELPWVREMVNTETGEVTVQLHPTFRAWSSSQNWGVRMADLIAASRRAVAVAAERRRELEAAILEELASGDTNVPPAGRDPSPPI